MRFLRGHWGFLLLVAAAAPFTIAFCRGSGIASISDDSVSYLVLARHFSGSAGSLIDPWVSRQAHFPPLFPLAIAAAGASNNLPAAHLAVAAFALVALACVYAYGTAISGRRAAGLLLAALFLVAPGSWISIKGILSEPLYLAFTLLALLRFASSLEEGRGTPALWVAFGLLVAAACLTRAAGMSLVVAFAVHATLRLAKGPPQGRARLAIPLLVVAAFVGAWMALRPATPVDAYGSTFTAMVSSWIEHPGLMLTLGARQLSDGWVAGFTADSDVGVLPRVVLGFVALLAVAGAVTRAARNHLDGWYVLATLALLVFWVFGEENTRRLLYPVFPLLLAHAAWAIVEACRHAGRPALASRAVAVAAALVGALCVPATMMVAERARDSRPLVRGSTLGAADITDYYTILEAGRARAMAAKQAAVITGLELIRRLTPPGARVMWSRPEYVALLGDRAGVALEYDWSAHELAEAVRRERVDFLVASGLSKTDLRSRRGDGFAVVQLARAWTEPVLSVPNAVTGSEEFVLLRVDAKRVDAFLRRWR